MAVAQWIKCSAGELKGIIFFTYISFKEEMNQMVNKKKNNKNKNNNNSSNSLVCGLWPQTKRSIGQKSRCHNNSSA